MRETPHHRPAHSAGQQGGVSAALHGFNRSLRNKAISAQVPGMIELHLQRQQPPACRAVIRPVVGFGIIGELHDHTNVLVVDRPIQRPTAGWTLGAGPDLFLQSIERLAKAHSCVPVLSSGPWAGLPHRCAG